MNLTEEEKQRFIELIKDNMIKETERRNKIVSEMTEEYFTHFIFILSNCEDKFLDLESLGYNPIEEFNADDFKRIWDYLETKFKIDFNDPKNDYSDKFPESRIFLQYKESKFIMRLLIGQGSALQFTMEECNDWPEKHPMLFDDSKKIIVTI